MKYLAINQCPVHKEYYAVSVDDIDEEGHGIGLRVTPHKCCGQWVTLVKFSLTEDIKKRIREAIEP